MCLPIIGAIISGIGSAMGAAAQAASFKAQAAYEERQAIIENEAGARKASQAQVQVDQVLGETRAGYAARGLAIDKGSGAEVALSSAEEGALDVATIRWNTRLAADNFMDKSRISKMNAGLASAAIPFAMLTPVLGAIGNMPRLNTTFGTA